MHQGRQDPPAGIVFRRLHTGVERELARSLLEAGGPSWRALGQAGEWVWFGLWDLAPTEGAGLVGAVATRPVAPRTVELCALAVPATLPWRGLGDRLVREVADTLRAQGAERMVARLPAGQGQGPALLRDAGFAAAGARPDGYDPGSSAVDGAGVWLSLEL
jgi:L-amino acid N-acyltransferase YncA